MKSLKIRINFLIINPIIRTVYYKRFAESSRFFTLFPFPPPPPPRNESTKYQMHVPITGADYETHGSRPTETTFVSVYSFIGPRLSRSSDIFYFFRPPTRMDHAASPQRLQGGCISLMGSHADGIFFCF